MAILNQNGINFNNINFDDFTAVSSIVSRDTAGKIAAGKGSYVTNAVSIDWNGMQLGDGQVINTTGELASYISTASTAAVNAQSTADIARNETREIRNELSSYITKTELAARSYITTSAADNKYQPKGSYILATGGIISDNPSEATDIYTHIEPDSINLVNYNDINDDGSISANKRSSITSYEFKLEYTEYQAGTEEPTIVYGPYSCAIKADDIVIKHHDNEVNGLSYLLDKINTLKSTSDNKYQPKGSYLPTTGGTIRDNQSKPSHIYTQIQPNGISLSYSYSYSYNISTITESKNIEIIDGEINVNFERDRRESNMTNIILDSYSCVITPNDIVIRKGVFTIGGNNVVNGLSYLLDKITALENRVSYLEISYFGSTTTGGDNTEGDNTVTKPITPGTTTPGTTTPGTTTPGITTPDISNEVVTP